MSTQSPSFSIIDIVLCEPLPLTLNGAVLTTAAERQIVFSGPDNSSVPGASIQEEASLLVRVRVRDSTHIASSYELVGRVGVANGLEVDLFGGSTLLTEHDTSDAVESVEFVITATLLLAPVSLVGLVAQPVTWHLFADGVSLGRCTTVLELYLVPPARYRIGCRPDAIVNYRPADETDESEPESTGLTERQVWAMMPVEALRVSACALSVDGSGLLRSRGGRIGFQLDAPLDWDRAAIARFVFFRNPPRYDIWNGDSSFVDIPLKPCGSSDYNRIALALTRYLAAIDDPSSTCDCFDMAAVAQVLLRVIGVFHTCYCVARPFGFMRLARLVGRGQSNNPFFGRVAGPPIVPPFDNDRTSFGIHSFVTLSPDRAIAQVIDTTAGPHLGREPLLPYLRDAVSEKHYDDSFDWPSPEKIADDLERCHGVVWVDALAPYIPPKGIYTILHDELGALACWLFENRRYAHKPHGFVSPLGSGSPLQGQGWQLHSMEKPSSCDERAQIWQYRNQHGGRLQVFYYVTSGLVANGHCALRLRRLMRIGASGQMAFRQSAGSEGNVAAKPPIGTSARPGVQAWSWTVRPVCFYVRVAGAHIDIEALRTWSCHQIEARHLPANTPAIILPPGAHAHGRHWVIRCQEQAPEMG